VGTSTNTSTSIVVSFRGKLKSAAIKDPGGVTTLAKVVGCSTLTARKHLERMVEDGELVIVKGTRGAMYSANVKGKGKKTTMVSKGKPGTGKPKAKTAKVATKKAKTGNTSKDKMYTKGQEVFVHDGTRKFVANVVLVSSTKGRVKVENSEGRSWVGVRSTKSPSGWKVRGTTDAIEVAP
jgi:hypothetical protein